MKRQRSRKPLRQSAAGRKAVAARGANETVEMAHLNLHRSNTVKGHITTTACNKTSGHEGNKSYINRQKINTLRTGRCISQYIFRTLFVADLNVVVLYDQRPPHKALVVYLRQECEQVMVSVRHNW